MTDVIKKTTNKFTKGLVMDFSPENTKNEVLTHALNATLLTFNGNEMSLLNDMGNARVETAFLPDGYMPVGTCEYGGIIYIVSYNPLEDKSLIGCFPSPERNISRDELGEFTTPLSAADFLDINTGTIKNNSKYILLKNDELHPGDKFIVTSDSSIYANALADLYIYNEQESKFTLQLHPIIALNIVSIEESGKIIYLNSDIRLYEHMSLGTTYKYHILGETATNAELPFDQLAIDLDSYRNVLSSGYSVFKQKTSGKLALLAELIMIDSYSVTHSLQPNDKGGFDIVIHNDVSPTIDSKNWIVAPKLQYLYLENSQGYLQVLNNTSDSDRIPLIEYQQGVSYELANFNNAFLDTSLKSLFTSTDPNLFLDKQTLRNTSEFNFPKKNTYHGEIVPITDTNLTIDTNKIITKFRANDYHRINLSLIVPTIDGKLDYDKYLPYYTLLNAKYYNYNPTALLYTLWTNESLSENYTYYVKDSTTVYKDALRDDTHEGKTLYKKGSELLVATLVLINNVDIDKYVYLEVYKYTLASPEYIDNDSKDLFYKDGNDYKEAVEKEDFNKTLYIQTTEKNLVNIGKTPSQQQTLGWVYYYSDNTTYIPATQDDLDIYWNTTTYPYNSSPPYGCSITLYYKETTITHREVTKQEILDYKKETHSFYYRSVYNPIIDIKRAVANGTINVSTLKLYIKFPIDTYVPYSKFIPDANYNWISGKNTPESIAPEENSIVLYKVSDYIPLYPTETNYMPYSDIVLASILFPEVLMKEGIDLPFKYDYTIVPCMNYGRLDHLRVSNTVDFSNLHKFELSGFNTWKYRIDGNQLRLTFGAEVYDTFENDKVDGLILEFYDLWGFVGSLEISNKKSYNGEFTKILYLNSLGTLSNKKVNANLYSENYQHNINIVEKNNLFFLNDKEVEWVNYDLGWRYKKEEEEEEAKNLETNDVGTLYPNLIYGVKTYLRKTLNKGTINETTEFIPKLEFFLYTLPIFNDYYYTTNNFNSITNPKLDFVLTYKLTDKSTKSNYSLEELITNGYYKSDKDNIDLYLQGNYKPTDLSAIKYYKYEGTSKLQLEIGLKQELTDLGLNYDPSINELFKCTLELKNNDNEIYTIHSDDENIIDSNLILNYYNSGNQIIASDLNYILFDKSNSIYSISPDSSNPFNSYNFLHNTGTQSININYEFIVGYLVNINKIRETLIPATTVCALFHKNNEGEYNYKDFGIHKSSLLDPIAYAEYATTDKSIWGNYAKASNNRTPQSDEECALLYDTIFYNSGDTEYERFGLCQQLKYQNLHYAKDLKDYLNLTEEVRSFLEIVTPVQPRHSGGILNSYAMRDIKNNIGKLAFCLPHIHTIDDNYGVSIEFGNPVIGNEAYENAKDANNKNRKLFMRDPTTDKRLILEGRLVPGHDADHDDKGHLAIWPHFNLSAITKELMELESQFISAIDYATTTDGWNKAWADANGQTPNIDDKKQPIPVRTYTGFTGKLLAIFNRKMLETMKSVYAYNPDYDYMTVNLGDVSVQNYNPYITSNIISSNSNIDFSDTNKTLNDYIYIGTILISSYLHYLNEHSRNENNIGITISKEELENESEDKFEFIPLLQFIPGFTYCGTQDNPYLISSLTYNLPVPSDLESELEFSLSDNIIIKDSEGHNYFLKGTPNKKMLYYYDHEMNKLIELDVANYTIDENGSLVFKNLAINNNTTSSITIDSEFSLNGTSEYILTKKPILFNFEDNSLNLDTVINFSVRPSVSSGCKILKYNNKTFYFYVYDYTTKKSRLELFTGVDVSTLSNNLVTYKFANNSIKIKECIGRTIPTKIGGMYTDTILENMSVELLDLLFSTNFNTDITINDVSYKLSQVLNHTNINDYTIQIPDPTSYDNGYKTWYNLNDKDSINQIAGQVFIFKTTKEVQYYASIYKITIDSADITATSSSVLTSLNSNIISFPKTLNYHTIRGNKYTVTLENVSIRGSSITLNDLIYDYQTEHRLFLNATRYSYDDKPNGKLYYRTYNRSGGGPAKTVKEYHLDTLPKNRIYLYTGPCYTENNL